MSRLLRIATRRSPLALWQAGRVATLLEEAHPGVACELVGVMTEGDRRTDRPISEIGGKGVFAKEVQQAVLERRADLTVHSAKDLTAAPIPGLTLAAIPERGTPVDALVGARLDDLPEGATVASGSQRRRAQLAVMRPDLTFVDLRGNIGTRLDKVPAGGAAVMAAVALERLGLQDRIAERFTLGSMVPQVGQGALAVEARSDDGATLQLIAAIEDREARSAVDAERAFLTELGGDCDLPLGGHAMLVGDELTLTGFLAASTIPSGRRVAPSIVRGELTGADPHAVGTELARRLRRALGISTEADPPRRGASADPAGREPGVGPDSTT